MRRLFIVSGAGLSVESGIPAFRTSTESGKALWEGYDVDEVCNIHNFKITKNVTLKLMNSTIKDDKN